MALLGRRVISLGKGRAYVMPLTLPSKQRSISNSLSHNTNASNTLLLKLLQLPLSQIKPTLNAHPSILSHHKLSSDLLLTSLRSSSPHKAHLVIEWKLERMLNDIETDCNQYYDLVSLCASVENVSLAFDVFAAMEERGIEPTSSVFNSLIRACLFSRNVLMSLSLFEIMESSGKFRPDHQTYDAFISGFSHLRDARKMQSWFAAKKAAGFSANSQNYESLISGCVKTRHFDDVDRYYEDMMSLGIMPSIYTLECVLEGICKRQNCDRVKEFVKFLLESGFEINGNMIDKVVGLYTELRRAYELEDLLDNLVDFNQSNETLSHVHCGIVRLYAMLDRLDDVEYAVGRMMNLGFSFRNPGDIEKVISSYFRQEAYDRLDMFLEHIRTYQKLTRSTYDLLAAGYRRAGLTEKLDLMLKELNSTAS